MPDLNIMPKPRVEANPALRVRNMLSDPDTFATTMLVLCLDLWGSECLNDPEDPERGPWHPTTFRTMLEERFGGPVAKCNLDKLMAAVTLVTTDLFFRNLDRFIILANILSGDEFDPSTWDKADPVECAWAITEALLLHPPDEPEPFSDEIRRYIGFVLHDEGYITPPDVLKIAIDGDFSQQVKYGFSDDPEMFSGMYAVQKGKTEEVESVLYDSLLELRQQLNALPMSEGSTAEVEQRLGEMLKRHKPEEQTGPEFVL